MTNKLKWLVIGSLMTLFIILVVFITVPKLSVNLVQASCVTPGCVSDSALAIASSIGRLDIISFVLGLLGIGLGFFALFSFIAIKEHAEAIATREAQQAIEIAVQRAEEIAEQRIDWLESELKIKTGTSSIRASDIDLKDAERATDDDESSS